MSRPESAAEGTEERILAAATRVLADDASASMQDIAEAGGVGRATLYRYYPCREDLLRAIRLESLRECRRVLQDVPSPEAGLEESLRQIVEALVGVLDRYRVLLAAPPVDRSDPEQRPLLEQIEAPILRVLRDGAASGELAPDLDPEVALVMLAGLLTAARRAIAEGALTAGGAGAVLTRVLLRGVAGPRT
jgi:TetR/AcrR family transcriptional repressor of mexCD-oprJ operon